MLIELLSTDNYLSFNIKVANILGLHTAIYLSELMNINDKAIRKNKIKDNYFTIDRKYIQSQTTISTDEQLQLEETLLDIGILGKLPDNENCICLDINKLVDILTTKTDIKIKAKIEKKIEKKTKSQKICEELKKNVVCENEELKQAYFDWIDAVYDKQGWMSRKAVLLGQEAVDEFSKRDLDIALKILDIAAINAYRDIQWAINAYTKDYKVNYKVKNTPEKKRETVDITVNRVQLSDEVF